MSRSLSLVLLVSLSLLTVACAGREDMTEAAGATSCTLEPPAQPFACTMQYDPVCGCDGKTYGNACSARGAGVPDHTPGACEGDES